MIPVALIRPEDGLGRKRDQEGHRELRQSIAQFGILTPVTVRRAADGSDDFLLIKGQGRTLACKLLEIDHIPAIIVDDDFADEAKVQQFLVENVARLRMRPVDRALLIARARTDGEETSAVARRFGVSSGTVRRLEAQLDGVNKREVSALKKGNLSLATHAVISRYVEPSERPDIVAALASYSLKTKEIESLFEALGWPQLVGLGEAHRIQRLKLLAWACQTLSTLPPGSIYERFSWLAEQMPKRFDRDPRPKAVGE